VPRLKCTFGEFIEIIEAHGFKLDRHEGTSHRHYRAIVNGQVRTLTSLRTSLAVKSRLERFKQ
jgi:hypothetical protein